MQVLKINKILIEDRDGNLKNYRGSVVMCQKIGRGESAEITLKFKEE